VHLNDALRKWPSDVLVDLHRGELLVHQMDYTGAVEVLRAASRRIQDENSDVYWNGKETTTNEIARRAAIKHLGPSIACLHGVAEFRVNPEHPEVNATLICLSFI
jgi:hypothetical protein